MQHRIDNLSLVGSNMDLSNSIAYMGNMEVQCAWSSIFPDSTETCVGRMDPYNII